MSLYDIITLLGFGFGSALTIILLSLSLQKKSKRYDDYAFGVVLISVLLWNAGNFLSLLLTWLFGSVAQPITLVMLGLGYIGLVTMPSSTLHVHLAIYFRSVHIDKQLPRKSTVALAICYLPLAIFLPFALSSIQMGNSPSYGIGSGLAQLFSLWMLLAIFSSILISERLLKNLRTEFERHFYRDLSYILGAIGIGLVFIYVIPLYRLAFIGKYFSLVMRLSPAIPMAVLAYYVYRYNFYRLVVKPSLIYSVIYGILMALYLLGVRRVGEFLAQFPEVNATFIEGLLLVALVFLFQPLRATMHARLDRLLFKERFYYQEFLRELSNSLRNIVDIDKLLQAVSKSLLLSFKAKTCTILLLDFEGQQPYAWKSFGKTSVPHVASLVQAVQTTKQYNLRRQVNNLKVKSALHKNKIELAIPIYSQDVLIGMICLSEKVTLDNYSDEELDVLQTFSNQIALAVANARLVQERINLEATIFQSEKLNSLGLLATSMAHEIKNPLSSIKTIIQVLQENAQGEDQNDLKVVVNEIDRLNSVINKLLGFARPSDASKTWFDVGEVIDDVLGLLVRHAEKTDVQISYVENPKLPQICVSKQNLREVILNLMINSVQSMPDGGGIEVKTEKLTRLYELSLTNITATNVSSWIEITIKDSGPGINPDVLENIFEPFFSTKSVGTGLGMVIVKRNLEEMNAALLIESNEGKGTCVKMALPVEEKIESI